MFENEIENEMEIEIEYEIEYQIEDLKGNKLTRERKSVAVKANKIEIIIRIHPQIDFFNQIPHLNITTLSPLTTSYSNDSYH